MFSLQTRRAARTVELRTDRRSFREIAQLVNLSPARCHQIYTAECDRLPAQALAEHRREALEMIDRAERDLITLAEDPQVAPGCEQNVGPRSGPGRNVEPGCWVLIGQRGER